LVTRALDAEERKFRKVK
jgi:hypothetical protein